MTWLIVKTNEQEANEIYRGDKRFIIRSDKDVINKGDNMSFQVMKQGKPVYHLINKRLYEVTAIYDYLTAPIEKGYQFVGFKVAK
jgi:hypothetical protein